MSNDVMSALGDPTSNWRCLRSGPGSVKWVTGHKDVGNQTSHGKSTTGMNLWNIQKTGTWNVRGLREAGKLAIVEREATSYSIVGLFETRWAGREHFTSSNSNIYFSGHENMSRNGVAIMVNKQHRNAVKEYRAISDRIIVISFEAKPVNINIVQIYAPTSETDDTEIETFYVELVNTLGDLSNQEITIIMGDFNAKIGEITEDDDLRTVVGRYCLGERNERGERLLLHFCTDNNLFITNTGFKHHPRRLYT
ncbi:craniofacial development protein 2-like [Cataglyphis hispanica]|uniref:craniofacial development protein 2-like n=1 Tax=Cataglyphis hispanica TaxID=1086592 RepID=UPI00217FC659|nr:craniofacial development protein 2-like [Cataglyphis hispanica]XP_050457439.1 craniofacial development protein 2-like [Cataglyphis hispanica]